jgi:tetratricopeptide (TPR) repeat protein
MGPLGAARDRSIGGLRRTGAAGGAGQPPEAVVAARVTAYSDRRRSITHELARKAGIEVPADVERFFDAVQAGDWSEIKGLYNSLSALRHAPETAKAYEALWPAVADTFGAAALTTTWPADELLAYGESVTGAMAPGTVYITGTEAARYIPALLSDRGTAAPIIVTPDTLADPAEVEYLALLHPDRFGSLNREDVDRILRRNEAPVDAASQPGVDPKSVRAEILKALIERNPGMTFAVDGSFDLGGLAADIVPSGAVLEIRPGSGGGTGGGLAPARAAETAEYWKATARRLETESAMEPDAPTRREYAQMALIQGQVLASQNLPSEAEQTYRAALQMAPAAYEPVERLALHLAAQGRASEAVEVAEAYAQANPGFVSLANDLKKRIPTATPTR